jgi:hypothetical protein
MGSENSADQAWDFLSSWFLDMARFYRAQGWLRQPTKAFARGQPLPATICCIHVDFQRV